TCALPIYDRSALRASGLTHVILGIPSRHADDSRESSFQLAEVMDCFRVQAADAEVATEHAVHLDIGNGLAGKVSELRGLIVVLLDDEAAHARASRATRHVDDVERARCLSAVRAEAVGIEVDVNVRGAA